MAKLQYPALGKILISSLILFSRYNAQAALIICILDISVFYYALTIKPRKTSIKKGNIMNTSLKCQFYQLTFFDQFWSHLISAPQAQLFLSCVIKLLVSTTLFSSSLHFSSAFPFNKKCSVLFVCKQYVFI